MGTDACKRPPVPQTANPTMLTTTPPPQIYDWSAPVGRQEGGQGREGVLEDEEGLLEAAVVVPVLLPPHALDAEALERRLHRAAEGGVNGGGCPCLVSPE